MIRRSGKGSCITVAVGKDARLLETRQMIIEQAGCHSRLALTAHEVGDILDREHVRVVVLCYTLSEAERSQVQALASDKSPQIAIIEVDRADHSASELFNTISFVATAV